MPRLETTGTSYALAASYTGERFLLAPYLNVNVALPQRRPTIVFRAILQGFPDIVESPRHCSPPAVVDDPAPLQLAGEPHLGQQSTDRLAVFGLGLLDRAAHNKLVEDLPNGLRMIGADYFQDRRAKRDHVRLGSLFWHAALVGLVLHPVLERCRHQLAEQYPRHWHRTMGSAMMGALAVWAVTYVQRALVVDAVIAGVRPTFELD